MVTGIGGGMLRDVLAGSVPVIFEGVVYATPALAGAAVAVAARPRPTCRCVVVAAAGFSTCLGLRLLALVRGWRAPLPKGPANV